MPHSDAYTLARLVVSTHKHSHVCLCLQEEARSQLLSLLPAYSQSTIYIGSHTLGKEDLLVDIARRPVSRHLYM